jgi:dihydrodipicolinate synthase/N-acetylneuraminate lyase
VVFSFSIIDMTIATWWPGNKEPLRGIIPPIVTPLIEHDKIDEPGTRRLLEHVIQANVAGVFVLGTTGEFASLSPAVRADFIRLCCQVVDGRVPLLIGITDSSITTTIEMATIAKEAGASAVVLTAPFYFPLEQSEIQHYVERVLEHVDLPIMLYNMPGLTKVWFEVDTLRELAKCSKIVGIKDSSGDLEYFQKVCKLKEQRPDWTIMMGLEHLLVDAIQMGADGGVNGGANVEPDLFVSVCNAAMEGDEAQIQKLMNRVNALQAIYKVGTPGFRLVTATKCALSLKGICSDVMADPFHAFQPEERKQVKCVLDGLPEL